MSEITEKILVEALELPPIERAELIEQLLVSFEFPSRQSIDELWAKEAEDRIDAYERAVLPAITAKEIFEKVNGKVVFDAATGLWWQQSGSKKSKNDMIFSKTEDFIRKLNGEKFAGFDDWRLPTLDATNDGKVFRLDESIDLDLT